VSGSRSASSSSYCGDENQPPGKKREDVAELFRARGSVVATAASGVSSGLPVCVRCVRGNREGGTHCFVPGCSDGKVAGLGSCSSWSSSAASSPLPPGPCDVTEYDGVHGVFGSPLALSDADDPLRSSVCQRVSREAKDRAQSTCRCIETGGRRLALSSGRRELVELVELLDFLGRELGHRVRRSPRRLRPLCILCCCKRRRAL
jgi:hypothetical protein